MNLTMSNIIILNDLRSIPLLTAIKLKRNISNAKIIAHESIFTNREYGDHTNIIWKSLIKYTLIILFRIEIVKTSIKSLDLNEQTGLNSSLISITEDSGATELKYPNIYKQLKRLALGSKDLVKYINTKPIIMLYIFNGRTASSYLISKHCITNEIPIIYYEYAGHCNGFRLFPVPVHASGRLGDLLIKYYRYGDFNMAQLKLAAIKYKADKLNSKFVINNKTLPSKKYDIVVFLSSDHEFIATDFEIAEINWVGNSEFCNKVIKKYGEKYSYAIRCHPNSLIDPNWQVAYDELREAISKFKCNIDIYKPEDDIDSHRLILESKIVVTDLSTISLDSILLGKKVDIYGNTDINRIYKNTWMNEKNRNCMRDAIVEPLSLSHNFLVFRFSITEKFISLIIFYVHRSFSKYQNWKG